MVNRFRRKDSCQCTVLRLGSMSDLDAGNHSHCANCQSSIDRRQRGLGTVVQNDDRGRQRIGSASYPSHCAHGTKCRATKISSPINVTRSVVTEAPIV